MNPQAAQNYLRTKVMTATPEQLQLMLYDGAIRFADQGKAALQAGSYEDSYTLITKVQRIINELNCSLKHDVAPDLCGKLASLYTYIYKRLIEANVDHNMEALDESIRLLRYQRETWVLLMQELGTKKAGIAARNINIPSPDSRMEASISMQG